MIFIILFVAMSVVDANQSNQTRLCAGKNATSRPVIDYCHSEHGYLIFRCCRSFDNQTFVAADLTDFNLIDVPDFTQFANFNLNVIDLRSNPRLMPSVDNQDFLALKYLDHLFLPEQFPCPGGKYVWEIVNQTTNSTGNECMHQKDLCSNSADLCPEKNSYCSPNGPDHFLCLCKQDYHGYQCLRHGTFPFASFFAPTLGITVLTSAVLYWKQRRHLK